jgi:hypothetical protein
MYIKFKHMTCFELASLGDVTRNRHDPIRVAPPKVARASKEGDIAILPKCRQCKRAFVAFKMNTQ